jgi:uncharacterized protein (DUF2235 family)
MGKRLVMCFDGTWNDPSEADLPISDRVETNVIRFCRSIKPQGDDGQAQVREYCKGVGVEKGKKLRGGVGGYGLSDNLIAGYRFLSKNYEPDDEIFITGFSRGAYTARSLAGMIRNVGLVRRDEALSERITFEAYKIYQTRDDGPDTETARSFRERYSHMVDIKFLGVWDTVGALGIPISILNFINRKKYGFHDTELSSIVKNAYHAIATDEHRELYKACLWSGKNKPRNLSEVEQRWFLGAHGDVGGGYEDRRLSDIALRWIQDKAIAVGLSLDPVPLADDNYLGTIHDSYADFLDGKYQYTEKRFYRPFDRSAALNLTVDESLWIRKQADSTYKPGVNLGF